MAVAAIALAISAGGTHAQAMREVTEAGERPINWRWLLRPDAAQAGLLLDEKAASRARGGGARALIECLIGKDYHLSNCKVLKETPDSEMGATGLKFASYFKAASKDDKGLSTLGRRVRFTLRHGGYA